MRVLLVHNPAAGDRRRGKTALIRAYRDAGHVVTYQSTATPRWKDIVGEPFDVVIGAGGDGTIAELTREMASRPPERRVPLSFVPLGTANNIAHSLKSAGAIEQLAQGLHAAHASRFSVGIARAPWGEARFVESAGAGFVASTLRGVRIPKLRTPESDEAGTDAGGAQPALERRRRSRSVPTMRTELGAGLTRWQRALEAATPRRIQIDADGQDLSGDYLLVAAMNVSSIGPCIDLASNADWTDDRLDLVRVRVEDRAALREYLAGLEGCGHSPAPFPTTRVRRLRIEWRAEIGHVDDSSWPDDGVLPDGRVTDVTIEIETFVPLLVPATHST